jgi:hypothetical protein
VAEFSGKQFIRLELKVSNGTLGGAIATGTMEVDAKGEVKAATQHDSRMRPLLDVKPRGATLAFAAKDVDETDQFEMRLLDKNTGELTFVMTPDVLEELKAEGIPALKPVRLKKT